MNRYLVVMQSGRKLIGLPATVTADTEAEAVKLYGQPPAGTTRAMVFPIPHGGTAIPLVIVEDHWQDDTTKWGNIT